METQNLLVPKICVHFWFLICGYSKWWAFKICGYSKFVNTQNLQVLNIYGYSNCVGSHFFKLLLTMILYTIQTDYMMYNALIYHLNEFHDIDMLVSFTFIESQDSYSILKCMYERVY